MQTEEAAALPIEHAHRYRAAMRCMLVLALASAGIACGPTVSDPPVEAGGSQGSTSDSGGLDHGETSTTADPDGGPTGTSNPTSTSTSASDETGAPGELVPAESAITSATCNDDGTMRLRVEAFFEAPIDACAPPPDVPPDGYLLVRMEAWSQYPGIFEVGPGGPAEATLGMEVMTGTLGVEVWAPGHPTLLTLDVVGESSVLYGTIDLEPCTMEVGDCIPPPPDGG